MIGWLRRRRPEPHCWDVLTEISHRGRAHTCQRDSGHPNPHRWGSTDGSHVEWIRHADGCASIDADLT